VDSSGSSTRDIRTIFVSDVHLGCKHSRADALADFLDSQEPENLFFVGDFIDGWKLKKGWRWLPAYTRIVNRLIELVRGGAKLYCTPGNHDDFLRGFLDDFGCLELKDEFVYTTAAGQRLLITHGDQFDRFERSARWFTMLLSSIYDVILSANWFAGRFQKQSRNRNYAFSAWLKLLCKRFAMFISDYERQLVEHARKNHCDGIVCGHIHRPAITQTDEITYFNTGDWVEHCTALVEYVDGSLELWFLAPDSDRGTLDIVERIPAPPSAAPELEPALVGDSHHEFQDGFSHGDVAGWIDSEPDDVPVPAGSAAFAALTTQRSCPPPCSPKWPSWLAGLAQHGATAVSRIVKSPRHCWGLFVGPGSLWSWLRAEPFDCLEPRESV
jgi:UDP-2,3-diacylglucosamine pyrophosphatase LpxH